MLLATFNLQPSIAEATTYDETGRVLFRWSAPQPITVTVPYDGSASKNRRLGVSRAGRIYRQKATAKWGETLFWLLKDAISNSQVAFDPYCKTWVSILLIKVEKGIRKAAVNLVDEICDIAKQALGIDDAWFSVICDWQFADSDQAETVTVRLWQKPLR